MNTVYELVEEHPDIVENAGAIRDDTSDTKMSLISSLLPKNIDFDNNNKVSYFQQFLCITFSLKFNGH